MLASVRRTLAPPVIEEDEEKTRQAALLNTVILIATATTTLYLIASFLFLPAAIPFWTLIRYPPLILGWTFMRSGYVRLGSALFVTGSWMIQFYVWATTGGTRYPGDAGVIVFVVMAGLLLGSRGAFLFTVLNVAAGVVLFYVLPRGLLPASEATTAPLSIIIEQGIWSLIASLLLHLAVSSLNRALARSREELRERRRVEKELRASEERFAKIFNASPLPISFGSDGRIHDVNNAFLKISGYERDEVIGRTPLDLNLYEKPEDLLRVRQLLTEEGAIHNLELNFRVKSGELRPHLLSADVIELDGQPFVLMVGNDITERKKVEEAWQASEARFSRAFSASPISMVITRDQRFIDVNNSFLSLTGYARDELIGHTAAERDLLVDPTDADNINRAVAEHRSVRNREMQLRTRSGEICSVLFSAEVIELDGQTCYLGAAIDITERKRLEEQLHHSQKLHAVGQLAGGVAHDFNNMLTVIMGFGELLLRALPAEGAPLRHQVEMINESAARAAKLTQQMLAFSRRQVMEPRVLNINEVVAEMVGMLERLVGEHIEVRTRFDTTLKPVKADQGQLEQVVMNLAANARDAMPRGGKLSIETANVFLDAAYVRQYFDVPPGWYTMLAVSDTGEGMDAETLTHMFEPFFTTKERGKGTGLGLATVHGIVKQSGGHIAAYSEPEQGTSIKIYLPQTEASMELPPFEQVMIPAATGTETILLVEDEAAIKEVASEILRAQGYAVVEADGEHAAKAVEQYDGEIHLLLTDVVMPGVNGRELAERLSALRPGLKVLYMSGYTDDVIVHHGILKPHIAFLQKPFTSRSLAEKVRAVLDG